MAKRLNEKIANQMTRIVRSAKRARLLRKRGEDVTPSNGGKGKKIWVWQPVFSYHETFICPKCGGTHWGTSNFSAKGEMPFSRGHCHTPNCGFWWDRSADKQVFHFVKRPKAFKYAQKGKENTHEQQYGRTVRRRESGGKNSRSVVIVGHPGAGLGALVAQRLREGRQDLPVTIVEDRRGKEPWIPDWTKGPSGYPS